MMTQGTGAGTRARSGFGVLVLLVAACAGKDTPPFADGFEQALAQNYGGDDGVGIAGSAGSAGSAGATGAGGRAGAAGAGMVGAAGASMSAAGSGSGGGSAGAGASGEVCDAFGSFMEERCGSGGLCHGANASNGAFAESEAAAADFVNKVSAFGAACGVFIDSRNPEESLILTKSDNTYDKANCGPLQMPANGNFLTPTEIDCLTSWLGQFAN